MTINELSVVIGKNIVTKQVTNVTNFTFIAYFPDTAVKENRNDKMTAIFHGQGETTKEAINNYIKRIRGKILVINLFDSNKRFMIEAPKTLQELSGI